MSQAEYKLSPKARDDMEAVWLYSFSQWGLDQAELYIDDLASAFSLLASNSRLGTACSIIRAGYRKYPTLRHVIYYRKTDYGIEIVRVLHDRQLATSYL